MQPNEYICRVFTSDFTKAENISSTGSRFAVGGDDGIIYVFTIYAVNGSRLPDLMIEYLVGETIEQLDISDRADRIMFHTKTRLGILTLPTATKPEKIVYGTLFIFKL